VDVHGRRERNDVTTEWIRKTDDFVERAYGEAAKGASLVPCPCNKYANRKRKPKKSMVEHIWKNGFTPGYTRWIFHGEAHRTREEVLRQRVEDYDADAGVADMLNDYQEAQLLAFRPRGVPGPTSKLSPRAPAQMGRRETEREGGKPEGDRRKRGNPRPSCLSRAQVGCACSRGLQASAWEGARGLRARRPVLPAWPSEST
jgi:hypothetical protein